MRRLGIAVVLAMAVTVAACGSDDPPVAQPESSATPSRAPHTVGATTSDSTHPDDPTGGAVRLRFGTLTERDVDRDADGRNTTAAIAGMNQFAVDLYKAVADGASDNVVVGPYSVTFALGMIYAGARGGTASEMAAVLHADRLPPDDWHEGINAYDLTLDARTAGSPTTWAAANKVWTRPGLPLRDQYLDVLTGTYGSPLAEADFVIDAEAQRLLVNDWVASRTADRVRQLFPEGSFTPQTAMVLVNAVALDAPWEFPFDPERTQAAPFTRLDGSTVDVPTMHYDEYLPSMWNEAVQAVELPYGGGALSMVVIVPADFAAFESDLTAESLTDIIDSIEDGGIHLSMPRWSSRTHANLNDVLVALGMPSAFSGGADFSGMVDGGGLALDRVEHEAFVEVDEDGTRAAAATGGVMVESHGPTVTVNRPYLYVIRDRGAGTLLFIGRLTDPSIEP